MADLALTKDDFLGGRVQAWQPATGYRAGVDAVFLAASVQARSGQSILELGCGVGVASLCLAARVPQLDITGVELQPAYADLAVRNAAENHVELEVIQADLAALPAALRQRNFDHVIANPPYFQRAHGQVAADTGRETAFGEGTPLAQWVDVATRRLRPRGALTMIQRADRLADILSAIDPRLGSVEVLPLAPREGRRSKLIMIRAIKGGKSPLVLLPAVTLHEGQRHLSDADDYRMEIAQVLRNGAAFPWPEK